MKQEQDYIVIRSYSVDTAVYLVKQYLKHNYKPIGGMQHTGDIWFQTMYKDIITR